VLGQEVASLVDGEKPAGSHAVTWNAMSNGSGVYFARMSVSDPGGRILFTKTAKLLLLK
jgi:hypothetical protein